MRIGYSPFKRAVAQRGAMRNPVGPDFGLNLTREGLLSYIRNVDGVIDTVGLSVSDYANVDESVRDIFFIDASTVRPAADAYALAIASPLLNAGTMIGSTAKGVSLFQSETAQDILTKAQNYFGTLPGRYYHGYNIYGEYQTWTGLPVADYYVDSENGDDSNDGTSVDTAFATIAELLTHVVFDGTTIGLAAGGYWREELDLGSLTGVNVIGCGTGRRPVLDCSDVVSNNSFYQSGGYTNVYAVDGFGSVAEDETYLSVWDDGTRLSYVSSIAICDSTPGSFYVDDDAAFPKAVYVHALDGSNIVTNGRSYELSARHYGLCAGSDTTVQFVRGRRNLHGGGSIKLEYNATVYNCIMEDGNKHNFFMRNGKADSSIAWKAQTGGRTPASLFVHYISDAAGYSVEYSNCLAIGTDAQLSVDDGIEGFYGHAATQSDNFDSVKYTDILAYAVTNGISSGGKNIEITRLHTKKCKKAISSSNYKTAVVDAKIDLTWIPSDGIVYGVFAGAGTNEINIDGFRALVGASVARVIYGAGIYTVNNSVFYRQSAATGDSQVFLRYTLTSPTISFNNTIIHGSFFVVDAFGSNQCVQDSDSNVYYPLNIDWRIAGQLYSNYSSYITNYAIPLNIEQNTISSDPLFVDPENGDFSLQEGSPAISMGAGLLRPNIKFLEILSDEILDQW